jgi:hypothetical protein
MQFVIRKRFLAFLGGIEMKMWFLLLVAMLALGFASAEDDTNCVVITACVDGSDWVHLSDGYLTLTHDQWSPIGSHDDCPKEYWDIIIIDGQTFPIDYHDGQYYQGDDLFRFFADIDKIEYVNFFLGRGSVSLNVNSLYIDDNSYGGGDVYSVQICGKPYKQIPEFGAITVVVAIIGALIVFVYKKH